LRAEVVCHLTEDDLGSFGDEAPDLGLPLAAGAPADDRNLALESSHMARFLSVLVPARFVVPDPPFVRGRLRRAVRRVLPRLLAAERGGVEVAPGASPPLVTAGVDEGGAEHAVAVADERVRPVPLVDAEVRVELVGHRVPGHLPAHPRLDA